MIERRINKRPVVFWNKADFVPVMKDAGLAYHERRGFQFPDALRDLRDSGLLSLVYDGNYSVGNSIVGPDFLNPKLDGHKLYFVVKQDAIDYGKRALRNKQVNVVCNGDFHAPDQMTDIDWRVVRNKLKREPDSRMQVLEALRDRGFITSERKGNFGVYTFVEGVVNEIDLCFYLCFYFPNAEGAEAFAKAFEGVADLKVNRYD